MLTRLQLIQFETVLHAMIQFITGKIISSNHQLYNELLQLGQPERRGLWKQIGARIGSNELQVHDYFYNTWQLQFYEDPYLYRSELKQFLQESFSQRVNYKEAINTAMQEFQNQFPLNRCNKRKLYQLLYQQAQIIVKSHLESTNIENIKQKMND
ncbi:Conserved_hypothetical protein [Hexamita inflata]|uniref:Uncharacterized protein n=1 Tax=Hexamita inflata TaxID=28002 RepID=A0AA86Q0I4_9EUKA|nr:Conserved hypothetical protein [Hexamita inflata]CAI9948890.1 Conserved hypothetical protein [Hexamita inflata]CAI9948893.1 Conserved hypothetical protein [Hexamita inflata]